MDKKWDMFRWLVKYIEKNKDVWNKLKSERFEVDEIVKTVKREEISHDLKRQGHSKKVGEIRVIRRKK